MSSQKGNHREKVGVLVVHGIGQQRKFEHLQEMARNFAKTLSRDPSFSTVLDYQVILKTSPYAQYGAQHKTWNEENASVIIEIRDSLGAITELCFHEVWSADL